MCTITGLSPGLLLLQESLRTRLQILDVAALLAVAGTMDALAQVFVV